MGGHHAGKKKKGTRQTRGKEEGGAASRLLLHRRCYNPRYGELVTQADTRRSPSHPRPASRVPCPNPPSRKAPPPKQRPQLLTLWLGHNGEAEAATAPQHTTPAQFSVARSAAGDNCCERPFAERAGRLFPSFLHCSAAGHPPQGPDVLAFFLVICLAKLVLTGARGYRRRPLSRVCRAAVQHTRRAAAQTAVSVSVEGLQAVWVAPASRQLQPGGTHAASGGRVACKAPGSRI